MAATVVVANPLAPPSRDMQISTTQLSTSPDLLSPSDKSLLSALTPKVAVSDIGPALAQILAALAADADRISREVSPAISPGPQAVAALPEQTAYRPGPIAPAFIESANATPAAPTSFASAVVSSEVVKALNGLVLDTSVLGGKVVEAAYAVVDVILRVPQYVMTAALDVLKGDIAGALDTVKSALNAIWAPGLTVLDGIRDFLYGRAPAPISPPAALKTLAASATASSDTSTGTEQTEPDPSVSPSTNTGTSSSPGRDNADSARKRVTAPPAASLKPSATKSADSGADTATSTKGHGSSKPTTGTTRSTAGSARGSKNSSSAGSSSD
ncbi:hypothetical protein [Mycolicibacterium sp. P1-5]|uniref:hypothetical protein n=1 Tax=Mycolicibacterium sp. P1-5 TaxID=2024617 RepID=UPI0011EBAF76|nr:hypothetical protein [Mycolicibacterium sp. P1-5]